MYADSTYPPPEVCAVHDERSPSVEPMSLLIIIGAMFHEQRTRAQNIKKGEWSRAASLRRLFIGECRQTKPVHVV